MHFTLAPYKYAIAQNCTETKWQLCTQDFALTKTEYLPQADTVSPSAESGHASASRMRSVVTQSTESLYIPLIQIKYWQRYGCCYGNIYSYLFT